jgi:hypothetical protein
MPENSVARWYSPRGRLSEDEAGLRPARPLYRRGASPCEPCFLEGPQALGSSY